MLDVLKIVIAVDLNRKHDMWRYFYDRTQAQLNKRHVFVLIFQTNKKKKNKQNRIDPNFLSQSIDRWFIESFHLRRVHVRNSDLFCSLKDIKGLRCSNHHLNSSGTMMIVGTGLLHIKSKWKKKKKCFENWDLRTENRVKPRYMYTIFQMNGYNWRKTSTKRALQLVFQCVFVVLFELRGNFVSF